MARKAREISLINSYTVGFSSAGNVKFDKADIESFLSTIDLFKQDGSYKLIAYHCNATNFYLVLTDLKISIDILLRKISVSFAKKYNTLHSRRGEVFGSRANTVPAKDYNQLDNMICKIHNLNKITKTNFCSDKAYFANKLIDIDYATGRFGDEQGYKDFCKKYNQSKDSSFQRKLTDEELAKYINDTFTITMVDMQTMSKGVLETVISQVINITKASARQISRVTSLPLRFLWNLLGKNKKEKGEGDEE